MSHYTNEFFNIKSSDRVFGLDILRALAIFFVVYGHGTYIFSNIKIQEILNYPVLDGVSIFFVLSGFLIGSILIKKIETEVLSFNNLIIFWKRRWFRTLPNYFFILFLTYALVGNVNLSVFARYILFIQNFNKPHPSFFPEAWSLSIEEWFYLLTPIIIFIFLKIGFKPRQAVIIVLLLIIFTSVYIRYEKFLNSNIDSLTFWDSLIRKQVLTRMDSIMFGVLGAYINIYHIDLWKKNQKMLFFIGLLLLYLHKVTFIVIEPLNLNFNVYYSVYSFLIPSIGTLFLLPFLSSYRQGRGKFYQAITIASVISYSMYLINLSLVQRYLLPLIINLIPFSNRLPLELLKYILFWLITISISVLLYKFFEFPFTQLRDKSILILLRRNFGLN